MKLSFAPMEGITGYIFRRVHAELFGGADIYYSPFIAPDSSGSFKAGNLRDVLPENNVGLTLVPQILANNAQAFIAVARVLAEMGYKEVNLNVGCPSGTVVAKHKGSGMLADPQGLDNFLADIFEYSPVKISVKTRMGLESTDEFPRILEIYNKYPLSELIIHARDRAGLYKSAPDIVGFASAFSRSRNPVSYNGNIFCLNDADTVRACVPGLERIMLGRGAAADPSLFRVLRGGNGLQREELREFHDRLVYETIASGLAPNFTVSRMKELWFYMGCKFPDGEKQIKAIKKSRSISDYTAAVDALFRFGGFDSSCRFR